MPYALAGVRRTASELDRLKELIADVPGWLTDEEAAALYHAARECTGRGVIVEIGSWKGKSTICLGRGSRAGNNVSIYAIDPHAEYRFGDFRANIERAGIADLVTPVPSTSQAKADSFHEPIELLFIDGAHEYELVKEDFEKWVPKVVEGGVVAMHDTTWAEGPRRVAADYLFRSRQFKDVRFVIGSTSMGRKVGANLLRDRVRARYVLAVKTLFGWLTSLARGKRELIPKPLERAARRLFRAAGRSH